MDKRSIALGIFAVAAASAIWIVSGSYPSTADLSEGLGAAFFPRAIAVAMGLIGLIIAVQASLRRPSEEEVERNSALGPLWRPAAFILIMLVYFWALRTVGFTVATIPFLAAEMALLRVHIVRAVLYATLATIITFLLFQVVLKVPLPGYVLTVFW